MEFRLEDAVAVLSRTPVALRGLLQDTGEAWLYRNYGEGTFSPFDVLGHLVHGERADWIPRLHIILEQGPDRPFERFDRFAMQQESLGKTAGELLDEFERLRNRNLDTLAKANLNDGRLTRQGTHPEFGPVTAQQLIATWVVHDLGHLAQISRAMAFQYRDAVGRGRTTCRSCRRPVKAESASGRWRSRGCRYYQTTTDISPRSLRAGRTVISTSCPRAVRKSIRRSTEKLPERLRIKAETPG